MNLASVRPARNLTPVGGNSRAKHLMTTLAVRQREASIVFARFGLGAKRGQFNSIVDDPRGALISELSAPRIALLNNANLPSHVDACRASADSNRSHEIYRAEIYARLTKAAQPAIGFVERLVYFWSNHFNISANSGGPARSAVGEMERNRIRPNVLGNFKRLATSVLSHPAMIHYLQNGMSVGPNSPFGRRNGRGLNENLGRELLELHTVGVSAGYTQDDVVNASKILTGWSVVTPWQAQNSWQGATPATVGQFIFRQNWQEPGTKTVLGRHYSEEGFNQAVRLIETLAVTQETAQHIAFKLVKHFLTDTPTPNLVNPVARAFLQSDGDLPSTYRALINLPEAWTLPLTKFRRPMEMFIAQNRALGFNWTNNEADPLINALGFLGHKPWQWDSPDGFPDDSNYWRTPDAIVSRIAATQMILRRYLERARETEAPLSIARGVLGPNLPNSLQAELNRTTNVLHGLTILLTSAEFMFR